MNAVNLVDETQDHSEFLHETKSFTSTARHRALTTPNFTPIRGATFRGSETARHFSLQILSSLPSTRHLNLEQ